MASWYEGGPAIARRGVSEGGTYYTGPRKTIVELYGLNIKVKHSIMTMALLVFFNFSLNILFDKYFLERNVAS